MKKSVFYGTLLFICLFCVASIVYATTGEVVSRASISNAQQDAYQTVTGTATTTEVQLSSSDVNTIQATVELYRDYYLVNSLTREEYYTLRTSVSVSHNEYSEATYVTESEGKAWYVGGGTSTDYDSASIWVYNNCSSNCPQ